MHFLFDDIKEEKSYNSDHIANLKSFIVRIDNKFFNYKFWNIINLILIVFFATKKSKIFEFLKIDSSELKNCADHRWYNITGISLACWILLYKIIVWGKNYFLLNRYWCFSVNNSILRKYLWCKIIVRKQSERLGGDLKTLKHQ